VPKINETNVMFTLNCKGRLLVIENPIVMGIINATPDSFYDGSRFQGVDGILKQAEKMYHEGAAIIDIGGQSTRPGSKPLSIDEELERVIPAIESLQFNFPDLVISIDTYHAKVAETAVAAGAGIVNDISGGSFDQAMIKTVGGLGVPYICMHVKGDPLTMHKATAYEHLTEEVIDYFVEKIFTCTAAGITDLIIDPGFGFSKDIAQNFELLGKLSALRILEKPVLVGLSRKSTIYKTLDITPDQALNGTTVMNTISLLNGANILRVHDVKEAVEAIKLVTIYLQKNSTPG
jgi:dihydropteroate synthase